MQALEGMRVVDMAAVIAGPGAARYLADFGADVIKVESPAGDGTRRLGWKDTDGESFMWKLIGRNKRAVVLDLKTDVGLARMRELVATADVLIESSRPGALERIGLDPERLLRDNPRLVVLRVTGFGQDGPYRDRAGFATLAEAMSGFAGINGDPEGPPLLPPIPLTDEVTALTGAFAVMVALRHRDRTGEGQVVDVNLLESMLQIMGALPSAYEHLGYLQPRYGSGLPYTVPRNTYRCADDRWIAVSTSTDSIAHRLLALIGLGEDPRFRDFDGRIAHRDELDAAMREWCAARPSAAVLEAFGRAEAAIAPVYTMADLMADPHVLARGSMLEAEGIRMQGPVARLSRTPGEVRHPGRPLGADTDEVLAELDRDAGGAGPR